MIQGPHRSTRTYPLLPYTPLFRANVTAASAGVQSCVQGDANRDRSDYPVDAFDYAILSLTLQTTERPDLVVDELLRIAPRAFVSFPNFAHWRIRLEIGRAHV